MVIQKDYQKVLDKFIEKNGGQAVSLFAILKMDDLVDKWSVLLGAKWITENNRKDVFDSLANILVETLSEEEINEIARIGIFGNDNHLVELFLDKFQTNQYIAEDAKINGNVIHEGYIILCESNSE